MCACARFFFLFWSIHVYRDSSFNLLPGTNNATLLRISDKSVIVFGTLGLALGSAFIWFMTCQRQAGKAAQAFPAPHVPQNRFLDKNNNSILKDGSNQKD